MVLPDKEATNVQSHEQANLHGKSLERRERTIIDIFQTNDTPCRPTTANVLTRFAAYLTFNKPLWLPWWKALLLKSLPRSCIVSFHLRLPQKPMT